MTGEMYHSERSIMTPKQNEHWNNHLLLILSILLIAIALDVMGIPGVVIGGVGAILFSIYTRRTMPK